MLYTIFTTSKVVKKRREVGKCFNSWLPSFLPSFLSFFRLSVFLSFSLSFFLSFLWGQRNNIKVIYKVSHRRSRDNPCPQSPLPLLSLSFYRKNSVSRISRGSSAFQTHWGIDRAVRKHRCFPFLVTRWEPVSFLRLYKKCTLSFIFILYLSVSHLLVVAGSGVLFYLYYRRQCESILRFLEIYSG